MALRFRILPQYGLIYVRYMGKADVAETMHAMEACRLHPDFNVSFRHLVDFSGLTAFDTDYVALMSLQARITDNFIPPEHPPFLVYYAPNPLGQSVAQMVIRSWEGVSDAVLVLLEDKAEVMAWLGLPDLPFDSLDALTDPAA